MVSSIISIYFPLFLFNHHLNVKLTHHTILPNSTNADVTWSPTSSYIVTASDDKSLRLWSAETGDAFVEFRGHSSFVFSCKFNPQSNLLVSGVSGSVDIMQKCPPYHRLIVLILHCLFSPSFLVIR